MFSQQYHHPLFVDQQISGESLFHLLEKLPEGVIIRRASGHEIIYANPVAKQISGGLAIEGGRIDQLFVLAHPDDINDVAQQLAQHPNGGFLKDCLIRCPNGTYRWFNVRTFALPPNGELVAIFVMDIHDRKMAEKSLLDFQDKDALTGLFNRASFGHQVTHLLQQAASSNAGVLIGVLDLDGFRPLNDTMGRHMGDTILRQVSKRLSVLYKSKITCCVGRLGGDEFGVACLIPSTHPSTDRTVFYHASHMASHILGNLKAPFFVDGRPVRVGARLGMAHYPTHAMDFPSLLKCADMAVIESRALGRSGHRLYEKGMDRLGEDKQDLELALQRALHNQEFSLHYQPKIDLATRRCVGVEALVRWNRPGVGPMLPSAFIPALESSGLIVPLGDWVIHEACRQSQEWVDQGMLGLRIAVNVSAQQLSSTPAASSQHPDMGLLTTLAHAQRKYPRALLDIELTESAFMSNPEHAISVLHQIRKMGMECSIDDFGTGYSSLAYLKKFPVQCLKIDRSFISDMENSANDVAIVSAIVSMAHRLRLSVVAEGVENTNQLNILQDMGCDQVQGYVATPALSPEQLIKWVQQENLFVT